MKSISSELAAFLLEKRMSGDKEVCTADCYRVTLAIGAEILTNSSDVDIVISGDTFTSGRVMVEGLRYNSSIGLDADQQQITLLFGNDDTIGGIPIGQAIGNGLLNYARIERFTAFFRDYVGGDLVGTVTMFKGRVVSVDKTGAMHAEITVANSLVILENDFPRNTYAPFCQHVVYDSGCTLDREDFRTDVVAGNNSTQRYIYTPLADEKMIGGYVEFLSGDCTGLRAAVKNVTPAFRIELLFLAPASPAPGDTMAVYQGCPRTKTACENDFNNLDHFRGFTFVPPPQFAQ